MSGRGADPRDADVLAWLRRRAENARRVASVTPANDELHQLAADRARQIEVMIGDLHAGLHHGAAAIEVELGTEGDRDGLAD